MLITEPTGNAYSAMGHGRSDYEGYYGITDEWRYFSWHCHDFYELYLHLGGAEYYGVDNMTFMLQPNQFIIIPPFHMHGLLMSERLINYERAFLYISPSFLKYLGCGQIDLELTLTELVRENRVIFNMSPENARACAEHLKQVQLRADSHQPWDRFIDFTHILPVLRLMLETANTTAAGVSALPVSPMMHGILGYIEEHYAEPLTLKLLSEQFNVSPSALSHQFLRYTHHSVYEYIIYKRVMMAKQKLMENLPLNEVAFQCGFGDYSNFLRAFRKISGMSPSRYKKQLQFGA